MSRAGPRIRAGVPSLAPLASHGSKKRGLQPNRMEAPVVLVQPTMAIVDDDPNQAVDVVVTEAVGPGGALLIPAVTLLAERRAACPLADHRGCPSPPGLR